jgi:hypothetical protein
MSLRTATKSAFRYIDEISIREIKSIVFACIIVAAVNALVSAFRIGYLYGNEACKCAVPMHRDYSYDLMRLKIELALLVIAIALRSKKVLGVCISVVATLFIGLQYWLWFLDTQRWLREVNVSDFSQLPVPSEWPNFAGLLLATPWDFVILVFTAALFIWQVRVIVALINSSRRRQKLA